MKHRKWPQICLAIFVLNLASSCMSPGYRTADEMLAAMSVDSATFSKLPVCFQVRTFADVGASFYDLDHEVAVVPRWMDESIAREPTDDVADCIFEEGLYRLRMLSVRQDPKTKEEASLAVHALISLAEELKIRGDSHVQDLLNISVCKTQLNHSYRLTIKYYLSTNGNLPEYVLRHDKDAENRMKAELCGG